MPPDLIFQKITGFRLVTEDPARSVVFYRTIGFEIGETIAIDPAEMDLLGLGGTGSRIPMSLGQSRVDLDCFNQPGGHYPMNARACDPVFQHLALVTDDAAAAWLKARDAGATPISRNGAVTLPASAGGVTAVKFRDPDGHPLEFLEFRRGTNPDWTGSGVMGIDHSAISISDTAASRQFYARHALNEANATVNQGTTQDALDGLDAVKVDVLPMIPGNSRAHLELLGYRHPTPRAPYPLAASDIAATRIVWRSTRDALIRDPDGHIHQLTR